MSFRAGLFIGTALAFAGAATGAFAQTAASSASADVAAVDTVIITANKVSENVQNVPKSVQVVTSATLQRQNITDISDLQKLVPTIAGVGQTLSIRGVGTGASTIGAQSKVGIVLDDVPQPSRSTIANNLMDIERVEVLPGPQGTLAGRNATGGLINLVTRGPTSEWTGSAQGLATGDGERQAALFVAGPINEKVQISASQYFRGYRGLYKNIFLDKWSNDYVYGTREKVRVQLTDSLSFDGTVFYQYFHRNGVGGQGGGPNGGNPIIYAVAPPANYFQTGDVRTPAGNFAQLQPGVTPGIHNNEYASNRNGTAETSSGGAVARATYTLPNDVSFTLISSYMKESNPIHTDYCGCVSNIQDLNLRPEYQGFVDILNKTKNTNHELRINSAAAGRLHYVAGIYYSDLQQTYNYQRVGPGPVDWLRDFYNKSISAYAHADFDVTDKLKIQGGVRYEKDKISYNWTFLPLLATSKATTAGLRTLPDINVLKKSSSSDSDSFVNFDAGAQYKIATDIMAYLTYSQASQGPIYDSEDNLVAFGPNAMSPATNKLQPLAQEHVKNVEAGFKSQLFDRRLTLNVSAYYAKYQNYQVQTNVPNPDPNAPPTLKVASVGQVRTTGLEMNAAARISEHLRGDLNAAYTVARILDFPNAPCYNGATLGVDGCVRVGTGAAAYNTQGNLAGELLNRAPKLRMTASFEYSHPIGTGGLELYVTPLVKYATSQRNDLLRLPTSYIPATTIVDLNIGLRNDKITGEFFVRNLFKEFAQTYGVVATGFTNAGTGFRNTVLDRNNTRYFGMRVRYNY